MARTIRVKKITSSAYNKYGKVVERQPSEQAFVDNEEVIGWLNVVEFEPDIPRVVHLITEKKREMVLTKLERHTKGMELFVPVSGECVMAFAQAKNPNDPEENPDIDHIEVFEIKDISAFVVNEGVWHWIGFPIGKTASQLVVLKSGSEKDNVDIRDLPEPVHIVL